MDTLDSLGIKVEIKPDMSGSVKIDRGLKGNEEQGKRTGKAIGDAIGEGVKRGAREAEQALRAAANAARQHERAIANESRAAAAVGKAAKREVAEETRKAAAAERALQQQIAATTREYQKQTAAANTAFGNLSRANRGPKKIGDDLGSYGRGGGMGGAGAALGSGMGAAVAGAVGAYGLREIAAMADGYTNAANRIRQLTKDTGELAFVQARLFTLAQATGTAYEDTVALYSKVGKAALALGRSQEQSIELTGLITKALKASGAEGASASAALAQLGQALDSGVLRGEEFNSMSEQAPKLLDLLAQSLGVTRGELRKMAEAGKLTSEVVIKGLEGQGAAVDEAFAKRLPTINEQWVRFRNELTKTFGEISANADVSKAFGAFLAGVGDAVKDLAGLISGVAGAIGALNSALGGIPGDALEVLANAAKYSVPGVGWAMAAKDVYDYYSTPNQEVYDPVAEAKADAVKKRFDDLAKRVAKTETDARKGRGDGISADFEVPTGESRDLGAGGVHLQEQIRKEFEKQQKMLDAGVAGQKRKLDRFLDPDAKSRASEAEKAAEKLAKGKEAIAEFLDDLQIGLHEVYIYADEAAGSLGELYDEAAHERIKEATKAQYEYTSAMEYAARQIERYYEAERLAVEEANKAIDAGFKTDLQQRAAAGFEDALRSVMEFKNGFSEMAESLARDIAFIVAKMLLLKGIQSIFGAASGTSSGTGAGALLGGLITGNFGGGFAHGGTYIAPGSPGGGVDSRNVMFRVTPGERITFTPPGQIGPGGSGGGGGGAAPVVNTKVVNHVDISSALADYTASSGFERTILNIVTANAGRLAPALAR